MQIRRRVTPFGLIRPTLLVPQRGKTSTMKKIWIITYFIVLLVLAIFSVAIVWANYEGKVLIIEITANGTLLTGIILYLNDMKKKWWVAMTVTAVAGEIYLLAFSPTLDLAAISFWVPMLLPAIYMNVKISHLTNG